MDIELELELVAFPGITLVAPTEEEANEGAGQGMIDQFFHVCIDSVNSRRWLTFWIYSRFLHGLTSLLC